jgi:citrate lyase beta subunit
MLRSPDLRRSLPFVAGAEPEAHRPAIDARPDVVIQDLEDSTPRQLRQSARDLGPGL